MIKQLGFRIGFGGFLSIYFVAATAIGIGAGMLMSSDAFSQEKAQPAPAAKGDFQSEFKIDKGDLVSSGQNDYFILMPGYVLNYASADKKHALTITVLEETKDVNGVQTRVVEEKETEDGKPSETSLNWFAIDRKTNDVYYFGEKTTEYKDGKAEAGGDSWESGSGEAKFGLAMPAKPVAGMQYYEEFAPKVAMDRARVVTLAAPFKAGDVEYSSCLQIEETSAIDAGEKETKYYVKGIGQVNDEDMVLVSHGFKSK